jgi:hypothetical protein
VDFARIVVVNPSGGVAAALPATPKTPTAARESARTLFDLIGSPHPSGLFVWSNKGDVDVSPARRGPGPHMTDRTRGLGYGIAVRYWVKAWRGAVKNCSDRDCDASSTHVAVGNST